MGATWPVLTNGVWSFAQLTLGCKGDVWDKSWFKHWIWDFICYHNWAFLPKILKELHSTQRMVMFDVGVVERSGILEWVKSVTDLEAAHQSHLQSTNLRRCQSSSYCESKLTAPGGGTETPWPPLEAPTGWPQTDHRWQEVCTLFSYLLCHVQKGLPRKDYALSSFKYRCKQWVNTVWYIKTKDY